MKESFNKVWPIVLPILCFLAGVVGIIFFFVGPWGKGQYDVLAISAILCVLAVVAIIIDIIASKEKSKK